MKTLLHLYRQNPPNDFKESRLIFAGDENPGAPEAVEAEVPKLDAKPEDIKPIEDSHFEAKKAEFNAHIDKLQLDQDKSESEAEKTLKDRLKSQVTIRINQIKEDYLKEKDKSATELEKVNNEVSNQINKVINDINTLIARSNGHIEEKAPEPAATPESPAETEKPQVDPKKLLEAMQKRLGVKNLEEQTAFVNTVSKLDLSKEQITAVNEGKDLALTDQQKDAFIKNLETELKGDKKELEKPAKEFLEPVKKSLNGEKSENMLEKAFSAFQLLMVAKSAMESGDMQTIKDFLNDFEETKDVTKVYARFQKANEYYQSTIKEMDDAHQLLAVANEVRGEESNKLFPEQEKYRGVVKKRCHRTFSQSTGFKRSQNEQSRRTQFDSRKEKRKNPERVGYGRPFSSR
ncbi:hypothetical protein IPJ72_01455 [Candidatus Peregrinibacteria bacterium]|nr:MAG: hypothetical protein IPJ72_01455 [Candidatus Peregrinibacteria bacterium]